MKTTFLSFLMCLLCLHGLQAQFISTHSNDLDHNHYSIEKVGEDVIMGGTVYTSGSLTDTDLHFQRLDGSGNVVWEIYHDIGDEERCLDISMQGDDYLLATGMVEYDGHHRAFFMQLDPSNGSLVDFAYIIPDKETPRTEQMGLSVTYAPSVDRYYIVGQAANQLSPHATTNKDAAGLIVCLDNSLTELWTREVRRSSPTSQGVPYNTFNEVIDNGSTGIFAIGYIYNHYAFCFDYNGTLMWSKNSITGTEVNAAHFDPHDDRLLIAFSHQVMEILDASLSSAYENTLASYPDIRSVYGIDFYPESMKHSPQNELLYVYGYGLDGGFPETKPTLLLIDYASLQVQDVYQINMYGPGHHKHDFDYLSEQYSRKISRSDKLSILDDKIVLLWYTYKYYSGQNRYHLNIAYAGLNGQTGESCESGFSVPTVFPAIHSTNTIIEIHQFDYSAEPGGSNIYQRPHQIDPGCYEGEPCGFTINSMHRIDFDCYAYTYHVNVTPSSGTLIYEYVWDFGDGSPTVTTTQPQASHDYGLSNVNCYYNVCVTVKAIGSDGSLCQQTYCQGFMSLTGQYPGCPGCLSKRDMNSGLNTHEEAGLSVSSEGHFVTVSGSYENYDLTIYDVNGNMVMGLENQTANKTEVSGLAAGIYLVRVEDNLGRSETSKIFVR